MRTNERSRNNFVISTAICLMMALNSTVAKSANEQGANKIADAVKAVNSETNKQYDKTDNAKAITYSSASEAFKQAAFKTDGSQFCYPTKDRKHCLNCDGDGTACGKVPTYEVNGYNLPIYMSVDSNGFIKGLKDIVKPSERLTANGGSVQITTNRTYRYWDGSKGDFSPAYPFICSYGVYSVGDTIEQLQKQFRINDNKYNNAKQYVMKIGFKPKYNYDYPGGCGTGVYSLSSSELKESWSGTGNTGHQYGFCFIPEIQPISSTEYLNIKTGNVEKINLSKSDYLPCGVQESFTGKGGYSSDKGVCGDEYIKRYKDSQGNDLMTTYKAWFINDYQTEIFNPSYRTFDIPSRACYECKSTSIGDYCEEVINELINYCGKDLECIVSKAVLGGRNMRIDDIAEGRLPANLNCGGCLSKLETILKSKGFN